MKQTTAHTGTASTRLQFNAHYLDTDTNLYWLRARHYDPTTAQFITRDPYEAATGQPYAYAANDPLNDDDPAGLWPSLTNILTTGWTGAVINFMIGVGDGASLGLTGYLRETISPGSTCAVDTNSLAHELGYGGTDAVSMASGVGGIGRKALGEAAEQAARAATRKWSSGEAKAAARRLGYREVPGYSRGQKVFYNGKNYITQDIGSDGSSHSGGRWKMARTIADLSSKTRRSGTYDEHLNRIGD